MLSCPCCSPLDNMRDWKLSKPGWWKARWLAFLYDVYVVTTPERVGDVYVAVQDELCRRPDQDPVVAKRRCGTQLESALKHATRWSGTRKRKTQVQESGRALTSPPGNKESVFWELIGARRIRGGTVDEEVGRAQRVPPTHPPVD